MQSEEQSSNERTKVGFPDASEPQKSGNGKVIFLVIIILLILGGASWYLFSRKEETIEFTNDSITPTLAVETPAPEVMEEPTVDKTDLKIQIQNGTGTPGDAGKLEKAINELGYSETSTGNADNYDYTAAEVTFGSNFPENYKTEIKDELESMYSSVKEGSATLGSYDVVVITGKAKSSSFSKVSATVTPTEKLTTTPTP